MDRDLACVLVGKLMRTGVKPVLPLLERKQASCECRTIRSEIVLSSSDRAPGETLASST
jgi:hypothetical protein